MADKFKMSLDILPPSVNNYLKYTVESKGGHTYTKSYESKESKDFKKYLQNKLKKEIKDQKWDIKATEDKSQHWYLELRFRTKQAGEDTNNFYKVLMDGLKGFLYDDDSNIQARTHRAWIDKNNPGFDFVLRKVQYVGLFDSEGQRQDFINKNCASCRFFREGKCKILKEATDGRANGVYNMSDQTCSKFVEKKGTN